MTAARAARPDWSLACLRKANSREPPRCPPVGSVLTPGVKKVSILSSASFRAAGVSSCWSGDRPATVCSRYFSGSEPRNLKATSLSSLIKARLSTPQEVSCACRSLSACAPFHCERSPSQPETTWLHSNRLASVARRCWGEL